MNFLNGITLLLTYQLLGEVSVRLLELPVPGPVMGMVMLFLTLVMRSKTSKAVEPAASALLSHLSLLFVPAGVGLMVHFNRLGDEWLPIGATLILGTVVTMAATAIIMALVSRLVSNPEGRDD